MDILDRVNELLDKEQYKIVEDICLSSLLQPDSIQNCVSILSYIFMKTGHLKFTDKPISAKLQPLIFDIGYNLCNYSSELAITLYEKLLSVNPGNTVLLQELARLHQFTGFVYIRKDLPEKANEYFKIAFKLGVNKRHVYTQLVNFNLYNWDKTAKAIELLKPYMEFWDGNYHKDKTLLVYCATYTEGFGDGIRNIRALYYFQDYFKNIIVLARDPLIELFKNSFSQMENINIEFVDFRDKFPEYDYSSPCEINIIPNLDINTIPKKYLFTTPQKISYFKNKYFDTEKPKIGLCWQGSYPSSFPYNNRSMHFYFLEELLDLENVQFYSLQKMYSEGIENHPKVINLAPEFNNFDDTLAAITNLDIIVTVDTSMANLAGAAGLRTFLMLPKEADGIWGEDKPKLYETVEKFQQKEAGEWSYVIKQIKERLLEMY